MGSAGVVLDSSAKWGIFSLETTLEATDSDPRLHFEVVERSVVGKPETEGVNEIGR